MEENFKCLYMEKDLNPECNKNGHMGLFSWIKEKTEIYGTEITVLGVISSIIAVVQALWIIWNYMSTNLFVNLLIIASIFNFMVMLIFAFKGAGWKKERDDIYEERNELRNEKSECLEHHEKLLNLLGKENKEKQQQRLSKSATYTPFTDRAHTKIVELQADAIFDITTPEEIIYNEENEWLNKQKDGSS
jgi:hypothetical protein